MSLTTSSRFTYVSVDYDVLFRHVRGVSYRLVGSSSTANISLSYGNEPEDGTQDRTDFDILRDIYNDTGFLDADGNEIDIEINPSELNKTIDDFSTEGDYRNPFALVTSNQEQLTVIGTRHYRLRLWQQASSKPSDPPADWYSTESGVVSNIGDWEFDRQDADDANTSTTDPMWFALDSVSVGEDGTATYNGWEVLQEFDVEYSSDGNNWHSTQEDDDVYFGFRTADGGRRVIEIASPPDLGWAQIYSGEPYKSAGSYKNANFSGTVNLNLYERLRFTFEPFGYYDSGARVNRGGEVVLYLSKPLDGWESSQLEDNTDTTGTATWVFDDVLGGAIQFHEAGSRDRQTIPASVNRSGSLNGFSLPPSKVAGKLKFIGTDTNNLHMVDKIRLYDFGDNSSYRRFRLLIHGATY